MLSIVKVEGTIDLAFYKMDCFFSGFSNEIT